MSVGQVFDFSTLEPVPASFVRHRLRQRHGDLVRQVRFRGGWLYLLLLLEFQSTIEPAMAVRVLTFTSLQRENPTVAGSWPPRGVDSRGAPLRAFSAAC